MLHVPTDTISIGVTALQCLNLGAAANEMQSPTPYSKFAEQMAEGSATLPSRQGMLLIYMPAAITSAALLATSTTVNGREGVVTVMLLIHFVKRIMETLFVHKYSGHCSAPVAGFIGTFYALLSLLISVQTSRVPVAFYDGADIMLNIGATLFVAGELGNLYHHQLLGAMREPKAQPVPATPTTADALSESPAAGTSDRYVIPSGGGFDLVTMPHYSFELLAWFGIVACAQQLNVLLVALGMSSYLSGRAVATTRWYEKKFGDKWPKGRRHLVPFLF